MRFSRPWYSLFLCAVPSLAATFGTIVPHTAPFADIVLDQTASRTQQHIYTLDPTENQVDVFTIASNGTPGLTARVNVDSLPVSEAMSPNGQYLYVACYTASTIDIIDLTKSTPTKTGSVTLGANPEAVAVGYDGKVLISTIGGGGVSILATYNPAASASTALQGLVTNTLSAPTAITLPAPTDMFLLGHARFAVTPDGKTIAGVHELASTRSVFVYDVASATVLAARVFTGASPVIAISADGSKIVSGNLLLSAQTLAVMGTQNATNAPYVISGSFATQTLTTGVQGGAAFSPDGTRLYAAYNVVPLQNPAAKSNLGQLTINTPNNMLIQLGIQIPENFNGKMVISSDGTNLYALSQSGFTWLPISVLQTNYPVGVPDTNVALLASDQCGVTAAMNSAVIPLRNVGGGKMTVSTPSTVTSTSTSVTLAAASKSYGADITARFNAAAAKSLGTATPDELLLQSPDAVNIINAVRIYQNSRNAEAPGTIYPVDTAATGSGETGLTDIVMDTSRHLLYLANYALNRIEIFDTQGKQFLTPISVGQQPKALALSSDNNTLYVANAGSEFVSIVDLTKGAVSGQAGFPPLPFNSTLTPVYPSAIAASQRGVQVLMSNGAIYNIVGNNLVTRTLNPVIFGTATTVNATNAQMIATPDGAQILLLAGNGTAYIYDASQDDYIEQRSVVTVTGGIGPGGLGGTGTYFGPVAAGPNGTYFIVDDQVMNSSLSLISGGSTTTGGISVGGLPTPAGPATSRPIAAVGAVGTNTYIRFSTPIRTSATAAVTDAGLVELMQINATAGTVTTVASANTLEGPVTQVTGATRVNVSGRTIAYDSTGGMVYILTASGLSAIPLATGGGSNAAPQVSASGVVNTANFQRGIAPVGLVSIFGKNLATTATAGTVPFGNILGGTCVTLNNSPLPLLATASGQINAQIPPSLAAGTYPLVVRSIANQAASASLNVAVSKYAPAIFVDSNGPAIFHQNGQRVDQNHPATRDEPLTIYATGLGVTTGGKVTAGAYSPSSPLAVTGAVSLYFGDPTISNTGVIVDWSGLMPGSIGVYQINCRIPGNHMNGNALPVTLRIGGISSPTTGANVAVVYVD